MFNLKLSIIIPVYNSEKHLSECVNSVLNQTYTNFEIILVNDGSSDSSGKICDDFSKSDSRIITVHKKNGGTSSARNAGIDAATGDYITFMDNDDYWDDTTALETVMHQLEENNSDILMHENSILWVDTNEFIPAKTNCIREDIVNKPAPEALSRIIESGAFSLYCVWSKVFKTSIIKDNGVRFPEGMRNEDTYFCLNAFLLAKSYDWCNKSFYVYKKGHSTAQTRTLKYSHLNDLKNLCIRFAEDIEAKKYGEDFKNALLSYLAFPYCVWMGQSKIVKAPELKEDLKCMKKYRYLLKYNLHPNVKKIRLANRFLGFAITSMLLSFYIKHNNHL